MIEPSFREFKAKRIVFARDKSKNTFAVLISKSIFFENLATEPGPHIALFNVERKKHAAFLFTELSRVGQLNLYHPILRSYYIWISSMK